MKWILPSKETYHAEWAKLPEGKFNGAHDPLRVALVETTLENRALEAEQDLINALI